MYHILKLRKFCIDNGRFVSTAFKDNPAKRTCSMCNHQFHIHYQNCNEVLSAFNIVRHHSTNAQTAELKSINSKKRRKKNKLYVELLEVTQGSSSQKKASVSKVKAKDFPLLINQTHMNSPDAFSLETTIDSVQSDKMSDSCTKQLNEDISEKEKLNDELFAKCAMVNGDVFQASALEHHDNVEELEQDLENLDINILEGNEKLKSNSETINNSNSNIEVHRKKEKKVSVKEKMRMKQKEFQMASKEESLFHMTQSFLELCVNCNLLNRGMASLVAYRYKQKYTKREPVKHAIELYNILLSGFARTAQLNKVNDIFKMICDDNVKPNLQTYASCFECIGRLPSSEDTLMHLKKFADHMFQRGYTLNDLGVKPVFLYDQRELVLKAICILEPDFRPQSEIPNTCYSCALLEELNTLKDKGFESPVEGIFHLEKMKQYSQQQMEMEINDVVEVKTIEKRPEPNETVLYYRQKLQEAEENWRTSILQAFYRDLKVAQSTSKKVQININIYPYLKVLEPKHYVDIIMQEIRKLSEGSETFSPTMNTLCKSLGSRVRSRYLVQMKQNSGVLNKVEELYDKYCNWYINPHDDSIKNTRHKWQHLINEIHEGPSVIFPERPWPNNILLEIGRFLYNIIMKDIKIDVNITRPNSKIKHFLPAFYPLYRYQGHVLKEEVKPHPVLSRLFRSAAQDYLVFEATTVPMLSPPLPWTSIRTGGYLIAKVNMVRFAQETCQQMTRLQEAPEQQLYPSFDSLNQLGSIPWIVNKPILDTVIEVFNSGGSKKLDIPESPSICETVQEITSDMDKQERYQIYRKRIMLKRQRLEMYSLWCDALYRLSLANHFRDKVFWLPHNMDFRGRVYPCPPHLNHLGSDMARSLLYFAKGKPLGPNGFDWLKIHLINLTGLKKRDSLAERLKFANKKMPEILDSAEKPLTGKMWWAESEEPWQTLSCCMEIAKVLKSGDPENYVCHFPVHQDGSCNGLQHYAALGRDAAGAESVNLAPSLYPQDVYSCVAQLVEKERLKDANNGVRIAQILDGYVQRKVIKQTVMTTVYGVTRFGARLQIARQLKDLDEFPKDYVWSGSSYLVGKTFESLREMFTSTKEIQDWFTDCAKQISQVLSKNVEWVTPLGLPVVQPYSRSNKFIPPKSRKLIENFNIDTFEKPNVMKQKNAFPPNFIHSLDSSHMMLTSIFCERNKITFVSVHDCYWTHPSTINIMNEICRQQFVALHSQPILESLSEYLVNNYINNEWSSEEIDTKTAAATVKIISSLKKLPKTGNFDLNNVLKSVYFFS